MLERCYPTKSIESGSCRTHELRTQDGPSELARCPQEARLRGGKDSMMSGSAAEALEHLAHDQGFQDTDESHLCPELASRRLGHVGMPLGQGSELLLQGAG